MFAGRLLSYIALAALLFAGINWFWSSRHAQRSDLHVLVFDCGWLIVQNLEPFSPGNALKGPKTLANPCFVIRHPSGTLLWDAGLSDDLYGQASNQGNIHLDVRHTLASQLQLAGISADEIDFIAFSHLHFDHVGNAGLFTNARWLIQGEEYEAAFAKSGRQQGFNPQYYEALRDNPRTLLHGNHDVFGDGSVRIISAPGHTVGHQVLWIELPESGPVLLSGDLYHFKENRELRAFPSFNHSARKSLQAIQEIEKLLKKEEAALVIQHDPAHFQALPLAPKIWR